MWNSGAAGVSPGAVLLSSRFCLLPSVVLWSGLYIILSLFEGYRLLSLPAFKKYLCLSFRGLTLMYLDVVFFLFVQLVICRTSGICDLMSFVCFGEILGGIFSDIVSLPFFLCFLSRIPVTHTLDPFLMSQVVLCIFHSVFFYFSCLCFTLNAVQ